VLVQSRCAICAGSGVVMHESRALFGLMRKSLPLTCPDCGGAGKTLALEDCAFCEGRGLIGNESEVCRTCNGTGHAEVFAIIPRDMLAPGLTFHRRCERCGNTTFRLATGIVQQKVVKSWDALEELRQVEYQDACEVECTGCGLKYAIPVDARWHQQLDSEQYELLAQHGLDTSFLQVAR
jgi:RecJ-like exonuclease